MQVFFNLKNQKPLHKKMSDLNPICMKLSLVSTILCSFYALFIRVFRKLKTRRYKFEKIKKIEVFYMEGKFIQNKIFYVV